MGVDFTPLEFKEVRPLPQQNVKAYSRTPDFDFFMRINYNYEK
jgi:hypothetical protein